MSQPSAAYELAESIHSRLFNDPENQARGMIFDGEVRADISEPYQTQRLTIGGLVRGRRAHQSLSRSSKNGQFYLSTVFSAPGGKVLRARITENAPDDMTAVLEETLFMQAINKIYEARH